MESGSLIGNTKVHSKSERPLRRTIKEYLAVVGVLRIPNHAHDLNLRPSLPGLRIHPPQTPHPERH